MRSLPVPRISAEVSYNTSISRVADADLKQRLQSVVGDVVTASDGLVTAATTGTVASIPPAVAMGSVTTAELKAVYKQRFAKLRTPGRGFYDELVTSAPNGKCPLCAHRDVATLDHFLPQAAHPALTVAPVNLVEQQSDESAANGDDPTGCASTRRRPTTRKPGPRQFRPATARPADAPHSAASSCGDR